MAKRRSAHRALLIGMAIVSFHTARASNPPEFEPTLGQSLLREILAEKSANFSALISTWKRKHGYSAVTPLMEVAEDLRLSEKARSIALLGAAEIAKSQGELARPGLTRLLRDKQWLIRISALKGLESIQAEKSAEAITGRLKDPALVVRNQAAEALLRLAQANRLNAQPEILKALSEAMHAPENYNNQQALWVPQKALAALVALQAKSELPAIARLLDRKSDPQLVQMALRGLERITGEKPGKWTASEWRRRISGKG